MKIRQAIEEDIYEVQELMGKILDTHRYGKIKISKRKEEEYKSALAMMIRCPHLSDERVFVVEEDNKVMGFVQVEKAYRFLQLKNICVNDEYRQKHIGTELMKFVETYARDNNLEYIILNVYSFNKPARVLYDRLGYTLHGFSKGTIILEKKLGGNSNE